ncbi:hypothetical protein MSMTP_0069 [Methanosarcina sp. MTP4]|uniref:right-handed parallel beta-helix repeat-containing protein n=1 Tax=Methanosarcina sp. MTP4 TaxID=1434100 RepID=UPI0006160EC9|nr:NosD domain-containing protein [Methanosarcina sp. MTP4]AKB23538.1 hypothetical protein MSMTP_0069 [Methanosarcina sp. MTP4]
MQNKAKIAVAVLIALAAAYCALPLFYETFNYCPAMEEDQPYKRVLQTWAILTNQRVALDTEVPELPVCRLPAYKGKSPSRVLSVSFANSIEAYDKCTEDICFLVINDEIVKGKFKDDNTANNTTDNSTDIQPAASLQIVELIDVNSSGKYVIQQVRKRDFVTPEGNFPMSPLGRTRITGVEFVYFNGFETYPYGYEGETTYYPAWKLTALTSNYGDEVLMIKTGSLSWEGVRVHSGDSMQQAVNYTGSGEIPCSFNNTDSWNEIAVYPGDSIQKAINGAASGDIIVVYPGTYAENLFVDKPLTVISQSGNPDDTVIRADDPENHVFHVSSDHVAINGFNITGAGDRGKAGIYLHASDGNITDNRLVYNDYGIFLKDAGDWILKNNSVSNGKYGIYLSDSGKNTLVANKANNNFWYGMYLRDSGSNNLESNFANSNGKYGIFLRNSDDNRLLGNNISNPGSEVDRNGIRVEDSCKNKLINNDVSSSWSAVSLSNSSDNELSKNVISMNYFSICLDDSDNNKLLDNTVDSNVYKYGITLANSRNNTLKGNIAVSGLGVKVWSDPYSENNSGS